MTEPARYVASKGLKGELLTSAKKDRPPEGSRRRALAVAAVAVAATTQASSATAGLSLVARVAAWKWIAVGAVGLGTVVAANAVLVAPAPPATQAMKAAATAHEPMSAAPPAPRAEPIAPAAAPVSRDPAPSPAAPPRPTTPARDARESTPPVTSPKVETVAPRPRPQSSTLSTEIAAIDQAKQALAGGDAVEALRQVDAYRAVFPRGMLAAEASALRVEALARAGRRDEARAELARLRASSPDSPLLENLASIVGE